MTKFNVFYFVPSKLLNKKSHIRNENKKSTRKYEMGFGIC